MGTKPLPEPTLILSLTIIDKILWNLYNIFIQENTHESAVSKMVAIFFRSQYVNGVS